MKHSLRLKMTFLLSLSLLGMIFICWLLNSTLIKSYYQNKKVKSLSESFNEINLHAGVETYDPGSDATNAIEKIEASYNVSVYIISGFNTGIGHGFELIPKYEYPISMEMNSDLDNIFQGRLFRSDKYNRLTESLQTYIFGPSASDSNPPELLDNYTDKYNIFKMFDAEMDSSYIDLVGFLDNGYLIFIRSNYENIQESASISGQFLGITGCAVIILGSILMYVFSRSFTKPLLELSQISDEMSGLHFERKYSGKRNDEIGRLGNSINMLSAKLEETITELKAANLELEKDIAQKEEIDRMRKEFLSSVSHELKTPISLIQGYAEGLQDNINDDEESRNFYCEVIIDEAHKMNNMVKKLLTLNEIEFGSNMLKLERFDLTELVKNVAGSIDIIVKSKDVSVVINDYKPVYVWADESMIEEVITNYLSNALNHVDGQKIIDIRFFEHDGFIRVSVFNTGLNIPEEEIPNIWEKFYKIDKARTREYGGNGIGLSIVKAIIEQHKGCYGVINHSGGVEFWFELNVDEKDIF